MIQSTVTAQSSLIVQTTRQDASNPRFACILDASQSRNATLIKRLMIGTAPSNANQSRPGAFGNLIAARYNQFTTSTFSTSAQGQTLSRTQQMWLKYPFLSPNRLGTDPSPVPRPPNPASAVFQCEVTLYSVRLRILRTYK
jgi:hypothetical protein